MRSALHKKFLPPFKGGGIDPLLVGLESYWALDELSGTRFDSIGSNDLTDNNTVTYVNDGPRGVSASFVKANTEYLSGTAINANPTGDVTWSCWVKFPADSAWDAIFRDAYTDLASFNAGSGADPNAWSLLVNFYDGAWKQVGAAYLLAPDPYSWYNIIVEYIKNDKVYLYIDNVLRDSTACGTISGGLGNFEIGRDIGSHYGNQVVSRFGVWSKALSAPERAELYNSGRAKSYSDLSPGIKTNLVSYWNLDEVSQAGISGAVTRNDSHGTNHLTDNNTVNSYQTGPEQVVATFVAASAEKLTNAGIAITSEQAWSAVGWVKVTSNGICFLIGDALNDLAYVHCGIGVTFYGSALPSFANAPPADGLWHMWAIVQSGTTSKSSIDGDTFLTAANTPNAGSPYAISVNHSADWTDFEGGPTGVWNRALSQAEVTALFNKGVAKKYSELSAGEKTNLISYWNLTELSGNRADSHGANTLTDNNSVLSVINMPDVADKVCAKFVAANNEWLNDAGYANSGDTTISLWFNNLTQADYNYLFDLNTSMWVYGSLSGWDLNAVIFDGVNYASAVGNLDNPTGSWNHLIAWYDSATKTISFSINNGTPVVSAALPNPRAAVTSLDIGSDGAANFFNGQMDEIAIWSRVLTAPERTRLFNLGKGVFYPTFT